MTRAHFTEDMAETLLRFFHAYADEGIVTLEFNDRGLWLVNPNNNTKQFLGQAVLSERARLFARARKGLG